MLTKNIFHILYYIFLFSVIITFLINPGVPERKYYSNKDKDKSKYLKCKICNIIIPKELEVNHCFECKICIIKLDHHCTWVGKCIGKNNIIFFYCFVLSLFGYIIVSLFTILIFLQQQLR